MCVGLYVKYLLFSSILVKLEFSHFRKNTQISNFIKVLSVRDEMFHTGGRTTETTQLIVVFKILRTRLNTPVMQIELAYICHGFSDDESKSGSPTHTTPLTSRFTDIRLCIHKCLELIEGLKCPNEKNLKPSVSLTIILANVRPGMFNSTNTKARHYKWSAGNSMYTTSHHHNLFF